MSCSSPQAAPALLCGPLCLQQTCGWVHAPGQAQASSLPEGRGLTHSWDGAGWVWGLSLTAALRCEVAVRKRRRRMARGSPICLGPAQGSHVSPSRTVLPAPKLLLIMKSNSQAFTFSRSPHINNRLGVLQRLFFPQGAQTRRYFHQQSQKSHDTVQDGLLTQPLKKTSKKS